MHACQWSVNSVMPLPRISARASASSGASSAYSITACDDSTGLPSSSSRNLRASAGLAPPVDAATVTFPRTDTEGAIKVQR